MPFVQVAVVCAGLFAGAAIYVNAVEHPARVGCGTALALAEFAPSYRRATVMQGSLAVLGMFAALGASWLRRDGWFAIGALLLGSVVPLTLLFILPTNRRLLDPALDRDGGDAPALLVRWGRLHAVRSVLSTAAFLVFLIRLSAS